MANEGPRSTTLAAGAELPEGKARMAGRRVAPKMMRVLENMLMDIRMVMVRMLCFGFSLRKVVNVFSLIRKSRGICKRFYIAPVWYLDLHECPLLLIFGINLVTRTVRLSVFPGHV